MADEKRSWKRAAEFFGMWAIAAVLFSLAGAMIYLGIAFIAWNIQWPGDLTPTILRLICGASFVLAMFAALNEA